MRSIRRFTFSVFCILTALACDLLAPEGGVFEPDIAEESVHTPPASNFAFSDETRLDGAVRLPVPPSKASDQNPAFSPEGSRLLFTRFENGYNLGPSGLFILDLMSGRITRLTPIEDQDNVNLPGSAWNPMNDRIIFASDRMESDDLWRIAADGSDFNRITTHHGPPWYIEPSWSSDGEWIVFEASQDGNSEDGYVGGIWKVRADGSDLLKLTDSADYDDRQPNWSPQGDRILFQRRELPDGQWDLYTIDPDGGHVQNVTDDPASDTDASWSPDGQWIVYSTDFGNLSTPNIFVISATGGSPVRVTQNKTHEDGAPCWSPDGKWIAFESHVGQDEETPASLWAISTPVTFRTIVPSENTPSPLTDVRYWLYLIDVNLEPETVALMKDSTHDLIVLDFIPSEKNNTDYPMAGVISSLHTAPHPKLVLAYIDIGQAEAFRTYWQPEWGIGDPDWIAGDDPDGWEGNYPVAFWREEWKDIWLGPGGYLDAIIEAGFDGVYLDWVEAYSDPNVIKIAEQDEVDSLWEMIAWVGEIADFGRRQDPDFILIAQNAAELAAYDEYAAAIDAISQEQVWFDGAADNDPPGDCPLPRTEEEVDTQAYRQSLSLPCRGQYDRYPGSTLHVSSEAYLDQLQTAHDSGLIILSVDYATEPENVEWVVRTSRDMGFVPFVGSRALDQFIQPYE